MSRIKTALVVTTALLSNSFLTAAAFAYATQAPVAEAADAATLDAMESQCTAIAATYGPAMGQVDHFTGEVVEGSVDLVSGPTEVSGTRMRDDSTITPVGTFVPSVLEIRGDPFRTGGSVNLFGNQWATAGYYPDSTYVYTADFESTFAHAFDCNVSREVYHPAVPGQPVQGYYVVAPDAPGNSAENQQSCNAFTAAGATNDFWGEDHAKCVFNKTGDATDPQDEYWEDPVLVASVAGVAVPQGQKDSLLGFEEHGGRVEATGEYYVGQVVICNSPGSKGGSWRPQNGYNGGSLTGPAAGCNTPYFKVAPWGNGSQTSQGTWVSVPNYYLP